MKSGIIWTAVILAVFLPRLIRPDAFFIQDEQPWLDRSQLYTLSLMVERNIKEAARYPLSNHPAIPLMSVVGPALHWYGQANDLGGTYTDWSTDDQRQAAVFGRWVWGIFCSFILLALFATARHLRVFENRPWWAATLVIMIGLEPWVWGISRTVSVDVMIGLALIGSFLTGMLARERKNWWLFFLAGAWWGLAFISKSPALITAPFAIALAALLPLPEWKISLKRAFVWVAGAYVAMCLFWPPFLLHPYARVTDVLARAELHAGAPENYLWPGIHPPLFLFTLSTLAFIGCILYVVFRCIQIRSTAHRPYLVFDFLLVAGLFHGAVLIYVQGDHARKNLPVLVLLATVGVMGWLRLFDYLKKGYPWSGIVLVIVQLFSVGLYFPNVITAHNILFATPDAKRLLVDVGNGSRLVADYINAMNPAVPVASPMDSLIRPYLDGDHRKSLQELPLSGGLGEVPGEVQYIFVPTSLPARIGFDRGVGELLKDLEDVPIKDTLSIKNVPIFHVYQLP